MLGRFAFSLLAVGAALALTWRSPEDHVLACSGSEGLVDTDGDFLPDCIEWVVLTNAANPDTDGDSITDFVEVVQRGAPREPGYPMPADQEMRLVVTGPTSLLPNAPTWLHLLVRTVEPDTAITDFSAWLELPMLPGLQIPFSFAALGNIEVQQRQAGPDGSWLLISVPMASEAVLQQLLPCSFHVESLIGGRYLRSTVKLLDLQGCISTLVPYNGISFAVQSIGPATGSGSLSNRVCLFDLALVGSGLGGTIYQVVRAACEDCNEVECATNCPQSVGWLVTIPGGLGGVTGQD